MQQFRGTISTKKKRGVKSILGEDVQNFHLRHLMNVNSVNVIANPF